MIGKEKRRWGRRQIGLPALIIHQNNVFPIL
jgi:hypothetical protein